MGDSWLDIYKQAYDEHIMEVLHPQLNVLYNNKQYRQVVELARLILMIAPFNDEAYKYELRAFKKMKGKDHAKKMYDHFYNEYHNSFGEPYPIRFEDISQ